MKNKTDVLRLIILIALLFNAILPIIAQENLKYQKPPKEILELVDVPRAPSVLIDNNGKEMVLLYRDSYKTIAELSEQELRLGGLRINPKTNIGSRTIYYNNIKVKNVNDKDVTQVLNLPENARMSNFKWSPNQTKIAFANTVSTGVELWILDIVNAKTYKITDATINANMDEPISWFKDGNSLLVMFLSENKKELINTSEAIPEGPTVTISTGSKAQNRTYQDLLKNRADEFNFEQLSLSELYKVTLNGEKTKWKEEAMYSSVSFSPGGNYVLVSSIHKPFSYIVPFYRFPETTNIYKSNGDFVKTINEVPLTEVLPKGFMAVRKGKRNLNWRNDKPSTLVWVEALDEGDPEKEVEFRDEIFELEAPFTGEVKSLIKTINRFYNIEWGNENIAIAHDYWWNTRNTKSYVFNPSNSNQKPLIIFDRNYQDKYSEPGNFVTKRNNFGEYVLDIENDDAFLLGDGYTKEGQFPFIGKINLNTKQTKRLYQSEYKNKIENLYSAIDMKKGDILVRIEAPTEYPNYYIRNINKKNSLQQITYFENPFKSIQNVHKEVIKYKRDDGLELSGTLYLPVGYDLTKKGKMPMLLWAYPTEFKDKNSASQSTSNPNEFTYPYYGSLIYWITRGYVVLDDASFPIVGEGDEEPNDSFRKQLVANAKAAIDAVDSLGYIDRKRVACGGHSYGAFMVANLLSHSDLFAAGVARSGAYNRTLTPFGFQSEERNYWEAPEIYNTMSPFMHADKMKTPLLLIHGEADNNSGTYPLQSERYFNALKGLGSTVRLVILPKESHGYSAKESILHLLWEQDQWFEKYVKNRDDVK
ncbi:MAG: prolyl oligopeptidase family serine peptidase [Bacteroidales bacterium]|nr:prolyl oligopeptidase family serine peptidase [Bacteroidales bacterium]MBN2755750.1 prolyl oligopeptidase family serine peptidase [Bacteroidales bacterium]